MHHIMNALTLIFHALPNLDTVGGNARPAHWAAHYKDFQAEKQKWHYLIREQLVPPMPYFAKASAHVTLVFPERRRRDSDNLAIALKPLIDALKEPSSHPKDYGWGILEDDDYEHLTVQIEVQVDKARSPLTIVELVEVQKHEQSPA